MRDRIHYEPKGDGDEVLVRAEAPTVRELMARISTGTTTSTHPRWEHLDYFDLDTYPADTRYHMGRLGNTFVVGDQLNLSFLRAKDLHKGIEVTLRYENKIMSWRTIYEATTDAIFDFIKRHHVPTLNFQITDGDEKVHEESDRIVEVSHEFADTQSSAEYAEASHILIGDGEGEIRRGTTVESHDAAHLLNELEIDT
jgi:hypothetical protein